MGSCLAESPDGVNALPLKKMVITLHPLWFIKFGVPKLDFVLIDHVNNYRNQQFAPSWSLFRRLDKVPVLLFRCCVLKSWLGYIEEMSKE